MAQETFDPRPQLPFTPFNQGYQYPGQQQGASSSEPRPASGDAPPGQNDESYMHSANNRPFSQWGDPDNALNAAQDMSGGGLFPGPSMPQPRDMPDLLHRIVMAGRTMSHFSGMPMIQSGIFANAFWNAYQKGQKERTAEAYQQYRQNREMAKDRLTDEMRDYRDVFNLYDQAVRKGDKQATYKYHQALWGIADKYQDDHIKAALRAGNEDAITAELAGRDGHLMDLRKWSLQEDRARLQKQLEEARLKTYKQKQAAAAELDKRWGLPPGTTSVDPDSGALTGTGAEFPGTTETPSSETPEPDPSEPDPSEPDTTPPTEPATTEAAPSAAPTRIAQAGGGPAAAPIPGPTRAPGAEVGPIEGEAQSIAMSGKMTPQGAKAPPAAQGRAFARAQAIGSQLDGIANDEKLTGDPEAVDRAVRAINPNLANELRGYESGQHGPAAAERNSPRWRFIEALAQRAVPGWGEDVYDARRKAILDITSGKTGAILTSVGTAFDHLLDLKDKVDKGEKPAQGTLGFSGWASQHIPGYSALTGTHATRFEENRDVALHEMENALSNSRTATIAAQENIKERLKTNQLDESFKEGIEEAIRLLGRRMEELHEQFRSASGGLPMRDIERRFNEKFAASTDPDDRATPDRLRALSKYLGGGQGGTTQGTTTQSGLPEGVKFREIP